MLRRCKPRKPFLRTCARAGKQILRGRSCISLLPYRYVLVYYTVYRGLGFSLTTRVRCLLPQATGAPSTVIVFGSEDLLI